MERFSAETSGLGRLANSMTKRVAPFSAYAKACQNAARPAHSSNKRAAPIEEPAASMSARFRLDILPTFRRWFVVVGSGESGSPSAAPPSLRLGFSERIFKIAESVRACTRVRSGREERQWRVAQPR